MGVYDKKSMRGMTQASYEDTRMNKRRELNETMSIDENKTEDAYGQQVHSLSKQSFTDSDESEQSFTDSDESEQSFTDSDESEQ